MPCCAREEQSLQDSGTNTVHCLEMLLCQRAKKQWGIQENQTQKQNDPYCIAMKRMALSKEALPQALCPPAWSLGQVCSTQPSAYGLCVCALAVQQLSLSAWVCLQTQVLHLALHLEGKGHQFLLSLSSTEVVFVQSQGAPFEWESISS